MHPAYSVILFTTASGAGYGLLVLLALAGLFGWVPIEQGSGLAGFGAGLGLVTAGLLSSTFHLGRPERAWRAFSEWRTSWLSREGVAAVATYAPAGLLALLWCFGGGLGAVGGVLALLTVVAALATIYCTGMIYACLRTVPEWNLSIVPWVYIGLGLAGGGLLFNLWCAAAGYGGAWSGWLALALLLCGLALKVAYWRQTRALGVRFTAGDATGLGALGRVRPFEAAHATPNFVMREMGYRVGRRHAMRLRILAIVAGFIAPAALLLMGAAFDAGLTAALLALVSGALGVLVERWLFFAEARHLVTLYYGADAI
ncbi:MAG: dimethyl sulfoxide reductase anchor subunit [Rhizobiales bacterium]|nr:dimethyl sulfoxide reductase anchor subunit [Hyphomicrobiales bacterium]